MKVNESTESMRLPSLCLLVDFVNLLITWRLSHQNLHGSQCQDHDILVFVFITSAAQVVACTSPTASFLHHRCSAALVWFIFASLSRFGILRVCISATIVAHGSLSFIFIMVRWTNQTRWPTYIKAQSRQPPEPAVAKVNTFEI